MRVYDYLTFYNVQPNMSAGPDGIPGILVKKCALSLSSPLADFWNKSMKLGKSPKRLKEAFIIPQLKPGSPKNNPASYRPISQTSQLMKGYERVIKSFVQNYFEKKK